MCQEQVLGAIKPDTGRTRTNRHRRISRTVDVGKQFDALAIERDRLEVAVLDQAIAKSDIFSLQFPISRLDLGTGVQVDVSLAAVEGDQVAGAHLAENAAHPRYCRNAERAGQDCRVSGGP